MRLSYIALFYSALLCAAALMVSSCKQQSTQKTLVDNAEINIPAEPTLKIAAVTLTSTQKSELAVYEQAIADIDRYKDPQGYKDANLRALEFAKTLYPEPHPKLEDFKLEAAFGDFLLGNVETALKGLEDSLPVYIAAGPDYRDIRIEINNNLGVAYNALGNSAKAVPFLEAAISEWRIKYAGKPELNVAIALDNLAMSHHLLGKPDLALEENLESLSILERIEKSEKRNDQLVIATGNRSKYLGESDRIEESRANSLALISRLDELIGPDHPRGAYVYMSLASNLIELRQYESAENNARHGVDLLERHYGREKAETAVARNVLVNALISQSKYQQALPLATFNYEILEKGRGASAEQTVIALEYRARALFGLGRTDEALAFQKRAFDLLTQNRSETGNEWQDSGQNYARMLLRSGEFETASNILSQLKSSGELKKDNIAYHNLVMMQEFVHSHLFPKQPSLATAIRSEAWLDARLAAEITGSGNTGDSSTKLRIAYGHALGAAFARHDAGAAFRLMQKYDTGSLSRARAKILMRENLARSADRNVLEQMQDLQEDRTSTLQDMYRAAANGEISQVGVLSKTLAKTDTKIQTLSDGLNIKMKPAEVIQIQSLPKVQRALGRDTALIMTTTTPYGYHVFLVTPEQTYMKTHDLKRAKGIISAVSARVKSPMQSDSEDISDFENLGDLVMNDDMRTGLGGRNNIAAITNGLSSQIPLSIARYSHLGTKKWAVEDYAISYPSSVSDLLQRRSSRAKPVENFIGVGLSQTPAKAQPVQIASLGYAYRSAGDAKRLANLPPLPYAGTELAEISGSLSPKTSEILADKKFTESDVRSMDLADADVLAFATHGLMAGELESYNEAALVISRSSLTQESRNDGILTASEISKLKLSAEWVVLSACNSGSGSGERDEALSGLATAFTYAGAQSLLVSHWPVRGDAAAFLTVNSVKNSQAGMSKAKALQVAMNDLRKNQEIPNASDPSIWAPFVLIGQ